ncbi:hypothetical protein ACQEVZ_52575 [Dactylosporangium sp. CA-152071]|uniref:hypothetical protein n=1 Tax=Dactylosporangium sp. CA-152071 TaxID=3239933 RepID=UPI003D8ABEE2
MDDIAGWKAAVRREIAALSANFEQRFGYPFDEDGNYVAEPDPGLVEDGIHSSSFEQPRLVAPDLQGFLRRLLVAVRAFVATGDPVDV